MWRTLNSDSKTRVLAKIIGSQDNKKAETKTAGGIILTGDATKEKDAAFGKVGIVMDVSDPNDPLKEGYEIIIGPRSGRSAIRSESGETLYILNRDEIWSYRNPEL